MHSQETSNFQADPSPTHFPAHRTLVLVATQLARRPTGTANRVTMRTKYNRILTLYSHDVNIRVVFRLGLVQVDGAGGFFARRPRSGRKDARHEFRQDGIARFRVRGITLTLRIRANSWFGSKLRKTHWTCGQAEKKGACGRYQGACAARNCFRAWTGRREER